MQRRSNKTPVSSRRAAESAIERSKMSRTQSWHELIRQRTGSDQKAERVDVRKSPDSGDSSSQ